MWFSPQYHHSQHLSPGAVRVIVQESLQKEMATRCEIHLQNLKEMRAKLEAKLSNKKSENYEEVSYYFLLLLLEYAPVTTEYQLKFWEDTEFKFLSLYFGLCYPMF